MVHENDAETIFERLEQHGRTWKVYVMEPMPLSFTGVIHFPRLKDRFATHFVPFSEFESDAAAGTLPDFSLIEPNMMAGHGDYHPAMGRSFHRAVEIEVDTPSSILAGEAFLKRVFDAYRSAVAKVGANVWNTALLIGWDEPGGTYDHVPPGPVPAPEPPHRLVNSTSPSTAPAIASPPSSCRRGSRPDRSSTRSIDTRR